jgi:hypothetical protein
MPRVLRSHRRGEPHLLPTAQPLTALSISQFAITIQSGTFFSTPSFLTFYSFVSAFSLKCRLGMRNHSQELCRQPPSHVVPPNIHTNSKYSNTIHIVLKRRTRCISNRVRKKFQSINVDYMQTDEIRNSKKGHLRTPHHIQLQNACHLSTLEIKFSPTLRIP